jgi:integrase
MGSHLHKRCYRRSRHLAASFKLDHTRPLAGGCNRLGDPRGARPGVTVRAMATIEERGASLRVNWRLGGGRDGARQSCTFSGPAKARRDLAEAAKSLIEARGHNVTRTEVYAALIPDGGLPDEMVPTLKAWSQTWLERLAKNESVDAGTVKLYRRVMKLRVLPFLGNYRLTEIVDVFEDWGAWLKTRRTVRPNRSRSKGVGEPLAQSTIGLAYAVLQTCLQAAVPKWLSSNPAYRSRRGKRGTPALPGSEPFEGIFMRPEEVRLILDNCSPLIYDMVITLLSTGLRIGELLALDGQNITRHNGQVVVQVRRAIKSDGEIGVPKSHMSKRSVTVNADTGRMLWGRALECRPDQPLFTNRHGKRWNEQNFRNFYWWQAVASAQRCPEHPPSPRPRTGPGRKPKLGIWDVSVCGCPGRLRRRPRPHDCRHTHASALIQAKWSPKKIQARLGHSNYLITMNTYGHLWDLGDTEELELVHGLLLPPRPTRRHGRLSVPRRGGLVRARTVLVRR